MAAKKTAKKAPAKKTAKKAPAKKAPAKKELDKGLLGKCSVMVKNGASMEAAEVLCSEGKITSKAAHKIIFTMQQG